MASISIVMSAYRRATQLDRTLASIQTQTRLPDQIVVVEDGFDGFATKDVCSSWKEKGLPIEYFQRIDRPSVAFSNSAIPKNCAIRKATGDILILQCPEVMYTAPTDLENLVKPVEANDALSIVAPVMALSSEGRVESRFCGPEKSARHPEFNDFCQAVWRSRVIAIGGFDESYVGWGPEDSDFAERLYLSGVDSQWSRDVTVHHQWHGYDSRMETEVFDGLTAKQNYDMSYDKFVSKHLRGPQLIANKGAEWGSTSHLL